MPKYGSDSGRQFIQKIAKHVIGDIRMESYKNKTVLITGATGLIGNNLVDEFMKMGNVRVIALSRTIKKLMAEFGGYRDSKNFRMIAQDISSPLVIDEPVDFIFHAAGSMEGKIIRDYPVDVIKPNIIGVMNCLEFLKDQKERSGRSGRLILFSSVTVYGNNTDEDIAVNETDTKVTEALDAGGAPYSQSKRMIEVITTAYARQYGVDDVIARFATVYGPTRIAPETAFFEFIRKGIAGEDIILNTPGLPRRDNIYIDDAILGVLAIGSIGKVGQAYNVSSNGELGNYASVDEIAETVAKVSSHDVKVLFKNESDEKRKPGLKLDNTRLKDLGWSVTTSLEEGIKKTIKVMSK